MSYCHHVTINVSHNMAGKNKIAGYFNRNANVKIKKFLCLDSCTNHGYDGDLEIGRLLAKIFSDCSEYKKYMMKIFKRAYITGYNSTICRL